MKDKYLPDPQNYCRLPDKANKNIRLMGPYTTKPLAAAIASKLSDPVCVAPAVEAIADKAANRQAFYVVRKVPT